jgi:hypothetical protein
MGPPAPAAEAPQARIREQFGGLGGRISLLPRSTGMRGTSPNLIGRQPARALKAMRRFIKLRFA